MAPVLARAASVRAWSDERLVAEQRSIAAERRRLDARAAVVAAEIVRRAGSAGGSGESGSATRSEVSSSG